MLSLDHFFVINWTNCGIPRVVAFLATEGLTWCTATDQLLHFPKLLAFPNYIFTDLNTRTYFGPKASSNTCSSPEVSITPDDFSLTAVLKFKEMKQVGGSFQIEKLWSTPLGTNQTLFIIPSKCMVSHNISNYYTGESKRIHKHTSRLTMRMNGSFLPASDWIRRKNVTKI